MIDFSLINKAICPFCKMKIDSNIPSINRRCNNHENLKIVFLTDHNKMNVDTIDFFFCSTWFFDLNLIQFYASKNCRFELKISDISSLDSFVNKVKLLRTLS